MYIHCNICSENLSFHDNVKILNKYSVIYYHCPHCGFVQTEEPYWLAEAYSNVIASADTGIMLRNLENANDLLFILKFIPNGIFMDFGGGHGILTRIMRDYGFDFYHYDKYAENLFARGFEAELTKKYNLITAYENFEHFIKPLDEIEKLLELSDIIVFSTELVSSPPPKINEWWYYAPSTGQHISFYSYKTLQIIADKYSLYLQSNKFNLHILSKWPLKNNIFKSLKFYNKIRKKLDITRRYKKNPKHVDDMFKIINMEKQ